MSRSRRAATAFGAAALAEALRDAGDHGQRVLLVREFVRGRRTMRPRRQTSMRSS